jgi:GNAT superfamily N-acetyltransferase
MNVQIRPYTTADHAAVIDLSILAWEPIFLAWERILGPDLYPVAIFPDWRAGQSAVVEKVIATEHMHTCVADAGRVVAGFVCYELNHETKVGEVQLLAVHPAYQNHGIGTQLNLFALQELKAGGMKLAVVGTGGDEGHAPARRAYEKAGYTGLPLMRYYQKLSE